MIWNAFETFVMRISIKNTMTKVQMIAIRPFSPPNFNWNGSIIANTENIIGKMIKAAIIMSMDTYFIAITSWRITINVPNAQKMLSIIMPNPYFSIT